MTDYFVQALVRQQMQERIAEASTPRVRTRHRGRQRLAHRLRRVADRLEA